jgi:hypothetical protein
MWGVAGSPGAGAFDTTLNGVTLDSTATGAIPRANPASGKAYVFGLSANAGTNGAAQSGVFWLIDRLWHNGGFTITATTAQTIVSPTWPSRCPTSAIDDTPSTGGYSVLLGLEVSVATGAGTPTATISYTNSAGTAGRSGAMIAAGQASSPAQSFYPIGLQAGDTGVRSVQSLTLSATWTSGTINLVAYRILGAVSALSVGMLSQADWYALGSQRIYDGACLSFLYNSPAASITGLSGQFTETQG